MHVSQFSKAEGTPETAAPQRSAWARLSTASASCQCPPRHHIKSYLRGNQIYHLIAQMSDLSQEEIWRTFCTTLKITLISKTRAAPTTAQLTEDIPGQTYSLLSLLPTAILQLKELTKLHRAAKEPAVIHNKSILIH